MTALSDALAVAQARAVAALSKAYLAEHLERDELRLRLRDMGLTDEVETGYLLCSLDNLRHTGADLPATNGAKPEAEKMMSDAQRTLIGTLCSERNLTAPDLSGMTWAKASELITEIKSGNYNPEKWRVPF